MPSHCDTVKCANTCLISAVHGPYSEMVAFSKEDPKLLGSSHVGFSHLTPTCLGGDILKCRALDRFPEIAIAGTSKLIAYVCGVHGLPNMRSVLPSQLAGAQ